MTLYPPDHSRPLPIIPLGAYPTPIPFDDFNTNHDWFSFYTSHSRSFSPRRLCQIRPQRIPQETIRQSVHRKLYSIQVSSTNRRAVQRPVRCKSNVCTRATSTDILLIRCSSGTCHSGGTDPYEPFHATVEYRDRRGNTIPTRLYGSRGIRRRHHVYVADDHHKLESKAVTWSSSRVFEIS